MNKTKTEAGKGAGVDVRLIDQWLAEHYEHPQDILGKEGLLAQLTKAVVERALSAARKIILTSLTPGTVYNVQARAIGGSTGYSDWSDPSSHIVT
jgi:hypothetical protein